MARNIFTPITTRSKQRYIPAEQYTISLAELFRVWSSLPADAIIWYRKSEVIAIRTSAINAAMARITLADNSEIVLDANSGATFAIYIPERLM